MPFKDKDKDRQWHRDYMRRKRQGVTVQGVTPQGVTNTSEGLIDAETLAMVNTCCGDKLGPTEAEVERCKYCGLPADEPSPQCGRH